MSQVKLFFDPMSQPARAVWLLLKANKLPMKEMRVDVFGGDLNKPEFVKVNPHKRIPTIEHDGFKLTESVAILKYLCSHYKIQDPWFPSESRQMGKVDEYLSWHHVNLRAPMAIFFLLKLSSIGILGPNISLSKILKDANPARVSMATEKVDEALHSFQNHWLQQKQFIVGEQMTIADLLASTEIEQTKMVHYAIEEKFPKVAEYLERMKVSLNPLYTESHSHIWTRGEELKNLFK